MRKLLLGGAAAALMVGVVPALAQTAPPPGVAQGTTPAPLPQASPRTHVRVMSDRVMTRDEVVTHVRDMFARLDTNKDGYVTREEVEALHQKMAGAMGMAGDMGRRFAQHGMMMGDRGAVFDKLDANHDGSISRQEFMAAQPQVQERRMIIMRDGGPDGAAAPGAPGMKMRMHGMGMGGFGGHLFDMADGNKDGRVSLAEAQAAALAHFDKADLNHDGKLTPEERQQAHQQMRAQRRPS